MKSLEKAKMIFKPILRLTGKICSTLFAIVTILLTFITFEDLGIDKLCYKILILISIILISFLFSFIYLVFIKKENVIWKRSQSKIIARYDDLFEIIYSNEEKIVVIPVNDTFETIVDNPGEVKKPLVSNSTIHGKWINSIISDKYTQEKLNDDIQEKLKDENFKVIKKDRGNNKSFDIGTIAEIKFDNKASKTTFYLLAISKFNPDNVAESSRDCIKKSIEKLVSYYDKHGQGKPIYIPLMGSGRSRTSMTPQDSFDLIKSMLICEKEKINGTAEIVVYKGQQSEVSIFD